MNEISTNQVENQLFAELFSLTPSCGKNIEVSFTAPDLSSESGLLLLREFDDRIGFIDHLNSCIEDKRAPYLIKHTYKEMLTQRIFQIACGYEDADDSGFNTYGSKEPFSTTIMTSIVICLCLSSRAFPAKWYYPYSEPVAVISQPIHSVSCVV